MIDLNAILDDFISGRSNEGLFSKFFKTKEAVKHDLLERQDKGQKIKDGIRSQFWTEIQRPRIERNLRDGFAKLLRPGSLELTEVQIKTILAKMQADMGIIAEMRYAVDDGEASSIKLSAMEQK